MIFDDIWIFGYLFNEISSKYSEFGSWKPWTHVYIIVLVAGKWLIKAISLHGWLVGWTTHSSSRGPQAQPPPADLRVSSGNVRAKTGTREEGFKTKEGPEQSQERATNELKSPTVTAHQPLAKHKPGALSLLHRRGRGGEGCSSGTNP